MYRPAAPPRGRTEMPPRCGAPRERRTAAASACRLHGTALADDAHFGLELHAMRVAHGALHVTDHLFELTRRGMTFIDDEVGVLFRPHGIAHPIPLQTRRFDQAGGVIAGWI